MVILLIKFKLLIWTSDFRCFRLKSEHLASGAGPWITHMWWPGRWAVNVAIVWPPSFTPARALYAQMLPANQPSGYPRTSPDLIRAYITPKKSGRPTMHKAIEGMELFWNSWANPCWDNNDAVGQQQTALVGCGNRTHVGNRSHASCGNRIHFARLIATRHNH